MVFGTLGGCLGFGMTAGGVVTLGFDGVVTLVYEVTEKIGTPRLVIIKGMFLISL